jgi:DNA invertase Pin-like site-specific DNA recombinase
MTNLESQRRQYDLVNFARQHGFIDVEVIDDDLGRSASGTVARPGFDRLVAWLCAGKVGAVLCQDASRLARNGRDWHHLLELCGLVEARVVDHDGVYNPCQPNDRLLLGMKGSISEFELGVLRTRMLDAARSKARRGELRLSVPFGYIWHREVGLGLDPDLRCGATWRNTLPIPKRKWRLIRRLMPIMAGSKPEFTASAMTSAGCFPTAATRLQG